MGEGDVIVEYEDDLEDQDQQNKNVQESNADLMVEQFENDENTLQNQFVENEQDLSNL